MIWLHCHCVTISLDCNDVVLLTVEDRTLLNVHNLLAKFNIMQLVRLPLYSLDHSLKYTLIVVNKCLQPRLDEKSSLLSSIATFLLTGVDLLQQWLESSNFWTLDFANLELENEKKRFLTLRQSNTQFWPFLCLLKELRLEQWHEGDCDAPDEIWRFIERVQFVERGSVHLLRCFAVFLYGWLLLLLVYELGLCFAGRVCRWTA